MTERALDWSLELVAEDSRIDLGLPRCIVLHTPIAADVMCWYAAQPIAAATPHVVVDGAGITVDAQPQPLFATHDYMAVAPLGLVLLREALDRAYTQRQLLTAARVVIDWWLTVGFVPLVALWQIGGHDATPRAFDWPAFHRVILHYLPMLDRSDSLRMQFLAYLQSPAQSQAELRHQLRVAGGGHG